MSNQRRCIRITGTRTGKLRAKVETTIKDAFKVVYTSSGRATRETPYTSRFEVTLGSAAWGRLNTELQAAIYYRAQAYVNHLSHQLEVLRKARSLEDIRDRIAVGKAAT